MQRGGMSRIVGTTLAILLAACAIESGDDETATTPDADTPEPAAAAQEVTAARVVDGEWALRSFGPAAGLGDDAPRVEAALAGLAPERPVTMNVTESGRVAGHAGCNDYFAEFREEAGHQLRIGPVGTTRKACEEDLMALEQSFLRALEESTMVFIAGVAMELRGPDGVVLSFERVEEEG